MTENENEVIPLEVQPLEVQPLEVQPLEVQPLEVQPLKPLTKAQLKQGLTSLKDIKIISDNGKNLIVKLENEFKGYGVDLDLNDSAILINSYLGNPKNHKSFMYSLARCLSTLGYIKTMTKVNQTLVNDIKRIGYDLDKKLISLDFKHKNLTVDDYLNTEEGKKPLELDINGEVKPVY